MKHIFIVLLLTGFFQIFAQDDSEFFESKVTINGYGEIQYNNIKVDNAPLKEEFDFHRFVLFIGYAWNEKWSLKSELELEHNLVKSGQGYLQLEQAYVEFRPSQHFGIQGGVLLVGAGLLNEYHEPVNFFGVERPEYNQFIIPTTWFGTGLGISGLYEGFDYKVMMIEGINPKNIVKGTGIRDGRQKGYRADPAGFMYNAKVDYVNIPGLRVGASFTYNNAKVDTVENLIQLAEVHARYKNNNIMASFEYGNLSLGSGDVEAARGGYIDAGYNVSSLFNIKWDIYPFIRYSDYNAVAKSRSGNTTDEQRFHFSEIRFGFNIYPISDVVLKFDYLIKERELNSLKTNAFNLGIGYQF